ncbi:hypothetical protein VTJ04DRAFT_6623 [Mycothermus thermophilus]|uniref:uncharacterized protein n=1 Tax=Humicola insolens TaxID=85995 RepID=UPI0037448CDB
MTLLALIVLSTISTTWLIHRRRLRPTPLAEKPEGLLAEQRPGCQSRCGTAANISSQFNKKDAPWHLEEKVQRRHHWSENKHKTKQGCETTLDNR